jgi:hypothetical protein
MHTPPQPTDELEAAYKKVYDDLDKRKTDKGWLKRKQVWVRGKRILDGLLASPKGP